MKGKNAALPKAIDELKEKEELSRAGGITTEQISQQHSGARPPSYKTISQTWDGIRSIQHSSTHNKGLRNYEHTAERTS